jgi:hypothetical protein
MLDLLDTGSPPRLRVASTDKSALNEVLEAAGRGELVFGDGDQAQTMPLAISEIRRLEEGPDYTAALGNALIAGAPIVKDLAISYDPAHATIGLRPRQ